MSHKRRMPIGEIIERNVLFMLAVCLGGLGIAVVTAANIGTTPISSSNYVISLHTPLTLGITTFIFNGILTLLQIAILGKQYFKEHKLVMLLQFPVTLVFASMIDLGMYAIHFFVPAHPSYPISLLLLALGSFILAFGISLQVCANVAMVPGEAFVKALSMRLKCEFGWVKTGFDLSLVLCAVLLSLVLTNFSTVEGVREGTVIGAVSIGPMVRLLLPRLQPRAERFFTRRNPQTSSVDNGEGSHYPVISLTRQYGCGGRALGQKLAEKLKYEYLDTKLIALIAKEAKLDESAVAAQEGRLDNALLFQMVLQDFSVPLDKSLSRSDALFVASARAIRKAAAQGPCVIVGRGADRFLSDDPLLLRVYLYADEEYKLAYCKEHYHEDASVAREQMRHFDKSRAEYYRQYFGRNLDDPRNYDLCLNVGVLGPEACCRLIIDTFKQKQALVTAA